MGRGCAFKKSRSKYSCQKLLNKFISIFWVPMEIHSEAKVFQEVEITKTLATVMHPQSDCMIEKYKQTSENMLACFVEKHQNDCDSYVSLLLMAYRASTHSSTGVSLRK